MLIALLLGTVIAGTVVTVLLVYVFNFEQTDDITAARQRGEMVLSILEGPVLHAGLGMPNTSPDFKNTFDHETYDFLNFDSVEMTSPVKIVDSKDMYIFYSIPSKHFASQSADLLDVSFDITVEPGNISSKRLLDHSSTFKSWVTFPTGGVPLYITSLTNFTDYTKLECSVYGGPSGVISQYDELHYIRAMHAWVDEGSFYTEDLTIQGQQPRVDGIEDIFFDYDSDNGLLTVYVLARGNQKDSDFATQSLEEWPSDFPDDPQYRLVVVRGSWRIRN
jgi:hypothetical protein